MIGLLAVAAVPKFINLSSDARISVLTQLSTSIKSANDLLRLKSYMPSYSARGVTNRDDLIDIDMDRDGIYDLNGVDVRLKYRYLDNTDIYKRIDIPSEFSIEEEGIDYTYIGYDWNDDNNVKSGNCFVKYTQAQNLSTPPTYEVISNGC
ncbi:MAG: pilus assembly protein PilD [Gammaproteobacteria bacterium]|nr:pilus assembly protein PilD [Gammaproteobacteria bacterium]